MHGMKILRMAPSTYSDDMVKEKSVAWNADARAGKVHSQYIRKAHNLNVECFSSEPDVQARPILLKLSSYLRVRGHCVGAFAVCSSDIHLLLRETVRSAVMRNWRQVGATSVGAAFTTCSARPPPLGSGVSPARGAPQGLSGAPSLRVLVLPG